MLAAGIITQFESRWTFSIVIATEKDGSSKFCLAYKKLNSVMHADRCPLPRVNELLDDVKDSSVFNSIDLFQECWKIKLDEACK